MFVFGNTAMKGDSGVLVFKISSRVAYPASKCIDCLREGKKYKFVGTVKPEIRRPRNYLYSSVLDLAYGWKKPLEFTFSSSQGQTPQENGLRKVAQPLNMHELTPAGYSWKAGALTTPGFLFISFKN